MQACMTGSAQQVSWYKEQPTLHSPFYSSNTCLTHAQELLVGLRGLLGNTGTVMEGSGFVGTDGHKHGMGSKPAQVQVPQVHSGRATAKGQL